jgi:hypothetical protein
MPNERMLKIVDFIPVYRNFLGSDEVVVCKMCSRMLIICERRGSQFREFEGPSSQRV